jgi:hypothetical protein
VKLVELSGKRGNISERKINELEMSRKNKDLMFSWH